jgi:hypothetical protein
MLSYAFSSGQILVRTFGDHYSDSCHESAPKTRPTDLHTQIEILKKANQIAHYRQKCRSGNQPTAIERREGGQQTTNSKTTGGIGDDERKGGGGGGGGGGSVQTTPRDEWLTKGIRRRHIGAERDMGSGNNLIERRGATLAAVLLVFCYLAVVYRHIDCHSL